MHINKTGALRLIALSIFLTVAFPSSASAVSDKCHRAVTQKRPGTKYRWNDSLPVELKLKIIEAFKTLKDYIPPPNMSRRGLQFPESIAISIVQNKDLKPEKMCHYSAYNNRINVPSSLPESADFAGIESIEAIWYHEFGHALLETFLRNNSVAYTQYSSITDRAQFIYGSVFKKHKHQEAIRDSAESAFEKSDDLAMARQLLVSYQELFSDVVAFLGTGSSHAIWRAKENYEIDDPHIVLFEAAVAIGNLILNEPSLEKRRVLLQTLAKLVLQRSEAILNGKQEVVWSEEGKSLIDALLSEKLSNP